MVINMKLCIVIFAGIALSLVDYSSGHGMMLSPAGRSSRWRYDGSAPINYSDNENYCGGMHVQWSQHGGKCGLCGDNYGDARPRANEIGGKYGGSGVIVQIYTNPHTAVIGFHITANHLGHISFNLCNLDEFGAESEACFDKHVLRFNDGNDKYYIGTTRGIIETTVVLPQGVRCNHCVLRWTYTTGNNWGTCPNGTGALGCGPQETFKSCADIRIVRT